MKRVSSERLGGFLSDWRGGCKASLPPAFSSPLPLWVPLWERVARMSVANSRRVRGLSPRIEPLIRRALRATFSRKGRREEERLLQPRFGQAAATASSRQLTISSVPPVGAATRNRA